MLKQRVVTGVVVLILVLVWLFFAEGIVFSGVLLGVCVIGFYELIRMYRFNFWQKFFAIALVVIIAISIYSTKYDLGHVIRFIATIFWCFYVPLILALQPSKFSKMTITFLGVIVFIGAFYAIIVLHEAFGSWQLLSIMAVAWIADTGAYFVGRSIGKHKLAPSISPGKSFEGAIGGIILSIFYLLLLKHFYSISYLQNNLEVVKFALIVTIISIIGDLFESWLKRVSGVKDSGNILPGHGGVFDRIDSLVAVVAVAYAMLYNLF